MKNQPSQSIEDYLKAIYELSIKDGRVATTHLAKHLGISPASVTGMIKKLSQMEPPYLNYQKHQGVFLTEAGERIALETLRHHRLLEVFLHEILGFPWDEVHEEADKLEHVISEKFEERMAFVLGNPEHDPHGDPIPNKELNVPKATMICLSDLRPHQKAIIKRVRDKDPKLLRFLSDLGLIPNAEIEINDYSEFDGNIHLAVKNSSKNVVLGPRITDQIHVSILN